MGMEEVGVRVEEVMRVFVGGCDIFSEIRLENGNSSYSHRFPRSTTQISTVAYFLPTRNRLHCHHSRAGEAGEELLRSEDGEG